MKKIKVLAFALVLGTTSLFASNTTVPDEVTKQIRTEIVNLLDAPEFSVEKDVQLLITFTFNSEGEIVVLNVNSKNRDVLNYVRENLNGKKITNPGEQFKQYTMPLKVEHV